MKVFKLDILPMRSFTEDLTASGFDTEEAAGLRGSLAFYRVVNYVIVRERLPTSLKFVVHSG